MTEKKGQTQEKCNFVHVSGKFELSKLELSQGSTVGGGIIPPCTTVETQAVLDRPG